MLQKYKEHGFTIIPCKENKAPAKSWKQYQKGGFPPISDFDSVTNYGFVCGLNGVEVIDVDTKYHPSEDIYKSFSKLVFELFPDKTFLINKTISGGYHYYFKSEVPEGNQKLAINNKGEVMFETRGNGGYVLCPPSNGYSIISGSYAKIPFLTKEERTKLFNVAKCFDYKHKKDNETDDIFKQYNKSDDILHELYKSGWKNEHENNDNIHLRRPGKKDGVSASYQKSTNILYVFTTSTSLDSEVGLSPVTAYIQLHGIDAKQARRNFIDKGFIDTGNVLTKTKKISKSNDKDNIFIKVKKYIDDYYDIHLNVITNIVECREKGGRDYYDLNIYDLYVELQEQNIKISISNLEAIVKSSFIDKFDYFENYFDSLKYNGDGYIEKLCSYIDVDDKEYWVSMFKKSLVRSIDCGLGKGINRFILILQGGKQHTGKSTFIRFLHTMPQRYYTESPLRDNKDTQFQFAQTFIYNLEELSALNKKDIETLKGIISQKSVNERKPYDRNTTYQPRRTNFFGSTNNDDFLIDSENTRWIIIKVNGINWDYSKEIDMECVWAEAYKLYKEGYNFNLTKEEFERQTEINKKFESTNLERDLIEKYIEFGSDRDDGFYFKSTAEIYEHLTNQMPSYNIKEYHLTRQLKQVSGITNNQIKIDGKNKRGYFVKLKIKDGYNDTLRTNTPAEEETPF